MISEGPALIESLPGELQIALNGALYPDEELLIAVRGNPREAFAATDRRLLVLQEPSVPGIAPVSVREVPLVTVSSVRAVPRPVGGRLMWETTHPDAPTSIDYPTYDGSKYELVAGRLRQMIGQTKNTPSPGVAGEPGLTLTVSTRPCPKCQALVPTAGCWWSWRAVASPGWKISPSSRRCWGGLVSLGLRPVPHRAHPQKKNPRPMSGG